MTCVPLDFTVESLTSDAPADNLVRGDPAGWLVEKEKSRAELTIKFSGPRRLHSIHIDNMGCGLVRIFAMGAGGGRGSWVGAAPLPSQWGAGGNTVRPARAELTSPTLAAGPARAGD